MVRTVKSNKDRQLAVKACLLDAGVPECLIKEYMGVEANTACKEDVIATLEHEGLRFHENPKLKFSHLCSSLSFYEALKKISLSNKTTMLMNDDKRLTMPFGELQELLAKLPYDAKVFQPQWYLHPEEMPAFPYIEVRFLEAYSPFAEGFLAYGDDVLIFTPKSAAWACEQIRSKSRHYKAGYCILKGKSKGLYTSKNDLTAEIGGQGYWKSGHGGH